MTVNFKGAKPSVQTRANVLTKRQWVWPADSWMTQYREQFDSLALVPIENPGKNVDRGIRENT